MEQQRPVAVKLEREACRLVLLRTHQHTAQDTRTLGQASARRHTRATQSKAEQGRARQSSSAVRPCSCNSIHCENVSNAISLYSAFKALRGQECTHSSKHGERGEEGGVEGILWVRAKRCGKKNILVRQKFTPHEESEESLQRGLIFFFFCPVS